MGFGGSNSDAAAASCFLVLAPASTPASAPAFGLIRLCIRRLEHAPPAAIPVAGEQMGPIRRAFGLFTSSPVLQHASRERWCANRVSLSAWRH